MLEANESLYRQNDPCPLAGRVLRTQGVWDRLTGWIGRPIPADSALCIDPCGRVHTYGVSCPIDVAHCDDAGRVLSIATLEPNRIGPKVSGTAWVWETRAKLLAGSVSPGDILVCKPRSRQAA